MSGKGSAPRPFSVPADTYSDNFDRIFRGMNERNDGVSTLLDTKACDRVPAEEREAQEVILQGVFPT